MDTQLLKELQDLLAQPTMDFHKLRAMYTKVFGIPAPGCKCKGNQIYNDLEKWYIDQHNKNTDNQVL